MINIFSILTRRKYRKYPIKRDAEGKSLRTRCFERFNRGRRPAGVAKELKMKNATVYRYYEDWKNLGVNFNYNYRLLQKHLRNNTGMREETLIALSKYFHISRDEVLRRILLPNGLK